MHLETGVVLKGHSGCFEWAVVTYMEATDNCNGKQPSMSQVTTEYYKIDKGGFISKPE